MTALKTLSVYQLYDRVIKLDLVRYDKSSDSAKQISIGETSGKGGYKPSIEVSVTMLPNSVCLNMTVRVTNMTLLQGVDIRQYQLMSVTLGYPNNLITFTGPIFSSYIEKPNPDGVMVFDGVVTGTTGLSIFSARPYVLRFFQKITMKELVDKICTEITNSNPGEPALTPNYTYCSSDLLNKKIDFQKGSYQASNAYAIINWLQNILYRWARLQQYTDKEGWTVTNDPKRVLQVIYRDDQLYIIDSHCVPEAEEKRQAIILQAVTSASYSGPALTVIAPYNPRITPGTVFYMNPIYFKGGASMPNQGIDASIYNKDDGLYRVIKEDIKFATYGNTNEMTLLAVPASMYEGDASDIDSTLKSYADQVKEAEDTVTGAMGRGGTVEIQWGNEEPPDTESVPPKSMWSVNYSPSNVSIVGPDKLLPTLSQMGLEAYGSKLFYLSDSELNETFKRNNPKGVPLMYLFPLIMVATYKRMQSDKKTYKINVNNPDIVYEGYSVVVPTLDLNSVKELIGNQEVAQIFKDVQKYYSTNNPAYAGMFEDIYNYLTKGKSS